MVYQSPLPDNLHFVLLPFYRMSGERQTSPVSDMRTLKVKPGVSHGGLRARKTLDPPGVWVAQGAIPVVIRP